MSISLSISDNWYVFIDLSMNKSLSIYLLFTVNKSTNTRIETKINVKFLPINLENLRVKNIIPPINNALKISLLNMFFLSSIIWLKISWPYPFE